MSRFIELGHLEAIKIRYYDYKSNYKEKKDPLISFIEEQAQRRIPGFLALISKNLRRESDDYKPRVISLVNEFVKLEDSEAIDAKIETLGDYHFMYCFKSSIEKPFIDWQVSCKNPAAIALKLKTLDWCSTQNGTAYGYSLDQDERGFITVQGAEGNPTALRLMFEAMKQHKFGYKNSLEELKIFMRLIVGKVF